MCRLLAVNAGTGSARAVTSAVSAAGRRDERTVEEGLDTKPAAQRRAAVVALDQLVRAARGGTIPIWQDRNLRVAELKALVGIIASTSRS